MLYSLCFLYSKAEEFKQWAEAFTFHRIGSRGPAPKQGYDKLSEKNYPTVEYKHEEVNASGREMRKL